ncbi:MAG: peptidase M4 [Betaproteobacteria bacterium]|nr:MAG: peptidase M4 [Betaproteobacteria bacterium]
MKTRTCLSATLSAVAIAVVMGTTTLMASPAAADDRPRADEVRKLRESGKILPMEDILNRSRAAQPGQIVEIELDDDGGRYTYEVKIIDDTSRVHKLELDASSGEVLSRKTR